MSEFRSAIARLGSESLPELPDARLEEDFVELEAVGELIELERLRRLAEIDRRRLFERDGHLSAASWLATRFKMAWGTARARVRIARALEHMPETRRALEDGQVSMSSVRVLVAAREADTSAFDRSEAQLVHAARIHSVGDLRRVTAHWQQKVERENGIDSEERLRARRSLHASVSFLGMVRVDGDLDPETGETLMTALGAVLDAESRGCREDDDRTPAQRRADALGEICRQWLDLDDRPRVAGERPHLTLTVGADSLAGAGGASSGIGSAEVPYVYGDFDHAGPVGLESVRRIACDASIRRVVMAAVGAAGCRPAHAGRVTRDAQGRDRSRPQLPVPRLRPASHLV